MANSENNNSLEQFLDKLQLNTDGLIPAIAQDNETKDILMMAWMNRDAIKETLLSGRVCYYSRSRQKLWRKGETSGQIQSLIKLRVDCDRVTIFLFVDQVGVACDTGRRSCFFEEINEKGEIKIISDVMTSPDELYKD